jgi:phosphate transport system ATP-binding protein
VSDFTAFFLQEKLNEAAKLIEFDKTASIFTSPKDRRTEDYITGRFG